MTTQIIVIIVNYRTPELTIQCLASLDQARVGMPGLEVLLVDGGSDDGSAECLARHLHQFGLSPRVTLLALPFNGGFAWANNHAIQIALRERPGVEFIYLINPDAAIEPNAVGTLRDAMAADPSLAAAGSRLVSIDGRAVGAAFHFPSIGSEFVRGANTPLLGRMLRISTPVVESDATIAVDWVTGASVMLRVAALMEVGLFDEGFFLYFEEVELMWRLRRAGWKIAHVPASVVRHIGGGATGIVDGGSVQCRLPTYWFRSRRRFHALVYGKNRARLATLAWITGMAMWTLRRIVGLGRHHSHAPHELTDLLTVGFSPLPTDIAGAAPRWDDVPTEQPAWARWS